MEYHEAKIGLGGPYEHNVKSDKFVTEHACLCPLWLYNTILLKLHLI